MTTAEWEQRVLDAWATIDEREEADFHAHMEKLIAELHKLGDVDRSAHFVCVLCLADAEGRVLFETRGTFPGVITDQPRGDNGFGYDPMFLPDGHTRTFGEMTADEKHGLPPRGLGLSHRARAFVLLAQGCLQA